MDLVKTKYKKNVNHITEYINTNIQKTTQIYNKIYETSME
jgi:hypothetical protein